MEYALCFTQNLEFTVETGAGSEAEAIQAAQRLANEQEIEVEIWERVCVLAADMKVSLDYLFRHLLDRETARNIRLAIQAEYPALAALLVVYGEEAIPALEKGGRASYTLTDNLENFRLYNEIGATSEAAAINKAKNLANESGREIEVWEHRLVIQPTTSTRGQPRHLLQDILGVEQAQQIREALEESGYPEYREIVWEYEQIVERIIF